MLRDEIDKIPVIILAAGLGRRLVPLTNNCPKPLIEIGKSTFLDIQLQSLDGCGLGRIFVITGYQHRRLEQHIRDRAICLFNPKFGSTNNIVSLWMARKVASKGFLLLNSDVLFQGSILRDFVNHGPANAIVVDDLNSLDGEDMKVITAGGLLKTIGKELPIAQCHGEYIGIARFDSDGANELFAAIHRLIGDGHEKGWYEEGFNEIASRFPIGIFSTAGREWIEVDDHTDLRQARQMAASGVFQVDRH